MAWVPIATVGPSKGYTDKDVFFLPLVQYRDYHPGERKTIDDLPEELLLEVFSYLPSSDIVSCSRVCRRWQCITQCRRLWRNLRYDAKGEDALDAALQITRLASSFHSLSLQLSDETCVELWRGKVTLSLAVHVWEMFKELLEQAVVRLAPHLKELTVRGLECHMWYLYSALTTAPFHRLTSFHALSQCGAAVDNRLMRVLCNNCPLIETLVLEGCLIDQLTSAGLIHLRYLKRLHTLSLERKLSARDIREMDECYQRRPDEADLCNCEAHDLSFLAQCEGLTSLTLSPCNDFSCKLPLLRSLTLKSENVQADGDRLDALVKALPELRDLRLIGYWRLDDDHLRKIRAAGPVYSLFWLEQLHVDGVLIKIKFDRP